MTQLSASFGRPSMPRNVPAGVSWISPAEFSRTEQAATAKLNEDCLGLDFMVGIVPTGGGGVKAEQVPPHNHIREGSFNLT